MTLTKKERADILKACELVETSEGSMNSYSCIALGKSSSTYFSEDDPLVRKYTQFFLGEDYVSSWGFSDYWTEQGRSERVIAMLLFREAGGVV